MRTVLDKRLADPDAEQVRRSTAEAIKELQDLPAASVRVIRDVVIPDNSQVTFAHKLGRAPQMVIVSPARGAIVGAGFVGEARGTDAAGRPIDPTRVIVLAAGGFGAVITVDVTVF